VIQSTNLQDRVETIRGLFIGVSAHQKLEHLTSLVRLLGYESAAIFGDCFDEVSPSNPHPFVPESFSPCHVSRN